MNSGLITGFAQAGSSCLTRVLTSYRRIRAGSYCRSRSQMASGFCKPEVLSAKRIRLKGGPGSDRSRARVPNQKQKLTLVSPVADVPAATNPAVVRDQLIFRDRGQPAGLGLGGGFTLVRSLTLATEAAGYACDADRATLTSHDRLDSPDGRSFGKA
jgi:hypothetical protein